MGILSKAKEVKQSGTLVMGYSSSGKSTLIRDRIIASGAKTVLWLAFNNVTVLDTKETANWNVALINTVEEVEKELLPMLNSGELTPDAICIDGIDVLRDIYVNYVTQANDHDQPSQRDWGQAGGMLLNLLRTLRSIAPTFGVVDVVEETDDSGRLLGYKLNLNPALTATVKGLFGEKVLTFVISNEDKSLDYKTVSGHHAVNLAPYNA